jgi:hypothetical protein
MASRTLLIAPLGIVAALAAGCGWWGNEKAAITERLREFTRVVNAAAPEGLGSVSRAAEIGSFFTDDVVVDLAEGSTPIAGRETLMAMSMRLQPRLAQFTIGFADANVNVAADKQSADVSLTVEFFSRDQTTRQQIDAREFKLGMRQVDGVWKMSRVTAVDTLK